MPARFMPAPHVRSAVHGDHTILLDLRRERYYGLDEVGTRVWALLSDGADMSAIVARLCDEFDAPAEQIEADVTTLLDRLSNDWRVITATKLTTVPREPAGVECALILISLTITLRIFGLRRSLLLAEWAGRRGRVFTKPSATFLESVVRKIDTVAAFFPGRALCLEQSLALYVCLRRAGIAAELRLGAQPYPFAAHAWVEYERELVGTSYDAVSKFVPFDRLVEAV